MKLLLFALAMLFMSCSPFGLNPMGYEILHEDLDTAWQRVASMKYIPDPENYIKSPREFFRDGGGDCEDFCVALMYLLGPDSSLMVIELDGVEHGIIYYAGMYIEPQEYKRTYQPDKANPIAIFGYDEIMESATNYGRKHI